MPLFYFSDKDNTHFCLFYLYNIFCEFKYILANRGVTSLVQNFVACAAVKRDLRISYARKVKHTANLFDALAVFAYGVLCACHKVNGERLWRGFYAFIRVAKSSEAYKVLHRAYGEGEAAKLVGKVFFDILLWKK